MNWAVRRRYGYTHQRRCSYRRAGTIPQWRGRLLPLAYRHFGVALRSDCAHRCAPGNIVIGRNTLQACWPRMVLGLLFPFLLILLTFVLLLLISRVLVKLGHHLLIFHAAPLPYCRRRITGQCILLGNSTASRRHWYLVVKKCTNRMGLSSSVEIVGDVPAYRARFALDLPGLRGREILGTDVRVLHQGFTRVNSSVRLFVCTARVWLVLLVGTLLVFVLVVFAVSLIVAPFHSRAGRSPPSCFFWSHQL